jgi:hypothetical protein
MAQSNQVWSLEGFKECREVLQDLSKRVQRGVGLMTLNIPANMVANAIRNVAPVSSDPRDKTPGSLKASIQVVKGRGKKYVTKVVMMEDVAAVPQEYGTTRQPAYPFARAAIASVESSASAAFAVALKAEVEAAAARSAKRALKR